MQPLIYRHDNLQIPLGERRKKSDLGRFSLDLSWAKDEPDTARSKAYPSPPMSGSPPLSLRLNLDSNNERGHVSHLSSSSSGAGPGSYRGLPTPQLEHLDQRPLPQRPFSSVSESVNFSTSYRPEHMLPLHVLQNPIPPSLTQFPPPHHQALPEFSPHHSQPFSSIRPSIYPSTHPARPAAPPSRDQLDFTSPKQQRKTKGHVASACVPCKKAHLRCDDHHLCDSLGHEKMYMNNLRLGCLQTYIHGLTQRPCSRCVSNGKEDACVDVQHKKRGRPRLRDGRESRYDGMNPAYSADILRRQLPLYNPNDPLNSTLVASIQQQRTGPNIHTSRIDSSPEPACAFLSLEMAVLKASKSFGETIGLQSILNRQFLDVVAPNDREKLFRLQQAFEEERREREPNYLPPIYLAKYDEERAIQSLGFGPNDFGQVRIDRFEMLTFQAPDGQQRTFQVRLGLAKKSSIYYIVVLLQIPTNLQRSHNPLTTPYTRESFSRESQYGYHNSLHGYPQNTGALYHHTNSGYGEGRLDLTSYRAPSIMGPTMSYAPMGNLTYTPTPTRSDYSQSQTPYQVPRSELSQGLQSRQHDLQLPPIRDSHQQRDNGKNRLNIGGLLDNPDPGLSRG